MEDKMWWETHPWRMVQTNLREIDMENMDAEAFAQSLKNYHATVVTLNAAGIIADYESKLPYQKNCEYLHGDSLKEVLEACHKRNIRVIARCDFTKLPKEIIENHPDWAYRDKDGNMLEYNGFVQTCINGEYQQHKVMEILSEVFSNFDFDGLFCNMSGVVVMDYDLNIHEPCHCENCKKMFKGAMGMDIPDSFGKRDAVFGAYMGFINGCARKQKQKMYESVKQIRQDIAVNGFDYFRTECNQDINHLPWVYDAAANSRRLAGRDRRKVVDDASAVYMGFQYRHTGISTGLLEIRQWQNLVYNGRLSVYTLGTMENKKDPSSVLASKNVFEFFEKNESHYMDHSSAAKVLLLAKPLMGRNDPEQDGLTELLSQCHIPFDEARLSDFSVEELKNYEVVVMADVSDIPEELAKAIDSYVEAGGKIFATGKTACMNRRRQLLEAPSLASFGLEKVEEVKQVKSSILEFSKEDEEIFLNCKEEKIGNIIPWNSFVTGTLKEGTKGYLHLIPEQPFGPPEICYEKEVTDYPGVVEYSYGKGKTVFAPFELGTFYYEFGYENSFLFFKDIMEGLFEQKELVNTSPMVEVAITEDENEWIIHLINLSGCFGKHYFKPLEFKNIEVNFNGDGKEICTLNGGKIEKTSTKITLDVLDTYEAIIIKK
ncbi:MAG: beta-galactosidase [Lachnospiraceae bacterium]|nr:beta-galactosidase [Lachnospiraceae bacterium]